LIAATGLSELASKSPDAQCEKPQCQGRKGKEVRPEIAESSAPDQASLRDGCEMMDRIHDGQGCIHLGMPSTRFNEPENENSSGLMKNPSSIDCLADLLNDAMVVPTPT
jgi:hypothetical protein